MTRYRLDIRVTPRPGILDPQGKAIEHALHVLGWPSAEGVRVGKLIQLEFDADGVDEARQQAERMCDRLLANPVVEDYEIASLDEVTAP